MSKGGGEALAPAPPLLNTLVPESHWSCTYLGDTKKRINLNYKSKQTRTRPGKHCSPKLGLVELKQGKSLHDFQSTALKFILAQHFTMVDTELKT